MQALDPREVDAAVVRRGVSLMVAPAAIIAAAISTSVVITALASVAIVGASFRVARAAPEKPPNKGPVAAAIAATAVVVVVLPIPVVAVGVVGASTRVRRAPVPHTLLPINDPKLPVKALQAWVTRRAAISPRREVLVEVHNILSIPQGLLVSSTPR